VDSGYYWTRRIRLAISNLEIEILILILLLMNRVKAAQKE